MKQTDILLLATLMLSIFWPGPSLAQGGQTQVTVLASQRLRQDGTVQYSYKVSNNGDRSIVALAIGADYYHGTSELGTYPLGWSSGATATDDRISSPSGWQPTVITTEESPFVEIEWRNNGQLDIQPGQVNAGFGIVVAQHNAQYLHAHWTAIFADATATSGQLLTDGSPRLEAKLTSASQITPGQWRLSIRLSNAGGGLARHISVTRPICRPLTGTGTINVAAPTLPATLNDLEAGTATTLQVMLTVPSTVTKFSITESGTLTTVDGSNLAFSSAQVFYPKN